MLVVKVALLLLSSTLQEVHSAEVWADCPKGATLFPTYVNELCGFQDRLLAVRYRQDGTYGYSMALVPAVNVAYYDEAGKYVVRQKQLDEVWVAPETDSAYRGLRIESSGKHVFSIAKNALTYIGHECTLVAAEMPNSALLGVAFDGKQLAYTATADIGRGLTVLSWKKGQQAQSQIRFGGGAAWLPFSGYSDIVFPKRDVAYFVAYTPDSSLLSDEVIDLASVHLEGEGNAEGFAYLVRLDLVSGATRPIVRFSLGGALAASVPSNRLIASRSGRFLYLKVRDKLVRVSLPKDV